MPYIKESEKTPLDTHIDELQRIIRQWPPDDRDGLVNYAITTLIDMVYFPLDSNGEVNITYHKVNSARGVLGCVTDEFYRRRAAPYEDHKMHLNGDVYRATKI